jgi:hypothetical protein
MKQRVLFVLSLSLGFAVGAVPARATQDASALIKRQSQEFSDASASGDAAVLSRLLDKDVVFINESGEVGSRADVVGSAGPPPPGVSNTLVQTEFVCRLHGPVAVTRFTDRSTVRFHGQTLHASYLSTEVWLDERGTWRMISSQTLALAVDPPAIALPSSVLDEYAGSYTAGPGYILKVVHAGKVLTGSVNGGKPFVLQAELKDLLFVSGQPRIRRVVRRDASGHVVAILSRREGHDIVLKRM